jgi:hypothetical protein
LRAQILARNEIKLRVDRQMHSVIADIGYFQHHLAGQLPLDADVPTDVVRVVTAGATLDF